MTITFEIDNMQDAELILNIAKRLGIKTQSDKNGKQNAQKLNATEYLFSTEANKQHLKRAIDYVENNGKLIEVDLDDLKNQLSL